MRGLPPVRRRLHAPSVQLVSAAAVMVAGAWLVALWMVGVVLMVAGLLWGVDAVLRDSGPAKAQRSSHDEVIERWRQTR